jgi:hypothetical protein
MAMHNFTPSHLVEKLCRKCKKVKVKALIKGKIAAVVTCDKCKAEDEAIFKMAQLAANRQSRNRAHRDAGK